MRWPQPNQDCIQIKITKKTQSTPKAVARTSPKDGTNLENGMASGASRKFSRYFVVNMVKIEQKQQKCNGEQENNSVKIRKNREKPPKCYPL